MTTNELGRLNTMMGDVVRAAEQLGSDLVQAEGAMQTVVERYEVLRRTLERMREWQLPPTVLAEIGDLECHAREGFAMAVLYSTWLEPDSSPFRGEFAIFHARGVYAGIADGLVREQAARVLAGKSA